MNINITIGDLALVAIAVASWAIFLWGVNVL